VLALHTSSSSGDLLLVGIVGLLVLVFSSVLSNYSLSVFPFWLVWICGGMRHFFWVCVVAVFGSVLSVQGGVGVGSWPTVCLIELFD